MRVELKSGLKPSYPTRVYVAYGMYWSNVEGAWRRQYNIIEPNDSLAGFDVLSEDEVDIIDPSLDHYVMIDDHQSINNGIFKDFFVHKAAYSSEDFYSALVNHDDPKNVEKLFQNMRDMGLEP